MGKQDIIEDDLPVATDVTPLVNAPSSSSSGGGGSNQSYWKDGLCSCCKYGCCHPTLWNAWCCPQILMSQVLTRLKFDMFGNPSGQEDIWKNTFKRVVVLVVIYYMILSLFGCPYSEMDLKDDDLMEYTYKDCPTWRRVTQNVVYWLMFLYTLVVMIKTRKAVRAKYGISTGTCFGRLEDCCCVFWCSCCTVAQLARQTADYDTNASICCSPTGLSANAPHIDEPEGLLTPAIVV